MEQVRPCGELAWHFQNHIQGWMNDLNMLLSCFREKIPGRRPEADNDTKELSETHTAFTKKASSETGILVILRVFAR